MSYNPQLRKPNGEWKEASNKAMKRERICWGIICILTALFIAGAIVMGIFVNPNVPDSLHYNSAPLMLAPQKAEAAEIETKEHALDRLKNLLFTEMNACENPSHIPVWPDDNQAGSLPKKDKVSIGDAAFKVSTVQRFYKKLHGTDLTDMEATLMALDPIKARDLAIESWIKLPGSINEWSCASETMKAQVTDISS
jgi:hypothetical protein